MAFESVAFQSPIADTAAQPKWVGCCGRLADGRSVNKVGGRTAAAEEPVLLGLFKMLTPLGAIERKTALLDSTNFSSESGHQDCSTPRSEILAAALTLVER